MKIEILGMGCIKCNTLYGNVRKAVTELDMKPEIEHVRDLNKIVEYGVMSTPALVIDGEVMASGRIPSVEEIKGWLKE
ncbi:MAG: TM0996/MTH895 family glutaredoxin-like protein [Candidatus Altiarchaeota archaeon]|nr:TM0996/MTH895 family glutaredoxin-like protein [Candidatus Altiarchaeota archaeon]